MGCGTCGSGGCSPEGCGRNGGCATGGCNKLNTYDWLGNMLAPNKSEVDNVYEVRFKNTRKAFYRNVNGLRLYVGDDVVVESDRGYDVGTLSLGGVVAELQMRKKQENTAVKDLPRIYRKANENDLELLKQVRAREKETLIRTREIVLELKLDMKLSDVEFQGDNAKAIFYYIADHRVDFRELIKLLAREFRIRVEMKQIGLRHEAGLVGGIGSCGRELCCSTWLTDFKTVSTSAARFQNLSLNPMKISGLCGRLKCCLNFELDSYMDALKGFPEIESLETKKGRAILQKTDIFKRKMWFSYPNETSWYPLSVEDVIRIVKMNEKGEKPEALSKEVEAAAATQEKGGEEFDFVDVVGTNVPSKNDQNRSRRKKSKSRPNRSKRGGNTPQNNNSGARNSGNSSKNSGSNQRNSGNTNRNNRGQSGRSNRGNKSKGNSSNNSNNKK